MYNLNKIITTNKIKQSCIYMTFFSVLILGIYVYTGYNKVYSYGGLDTTIQTALENLRPQDVIQDLYGSVKGGTEVDTSVFKNIYSKSYKLANIQEQAAVLQTYASLKEYINTTYKCDLSDSQVNKLFTDGGQTASAGDCIPLLNCRAGYANSSRNLYKQYQGLQDNKVDSSNDIKSREGVSISQYTTCKSFITTKYEQTYKKLSTTTTLINTTLGTDMYANGTTEDGGYDILYDIQKIGDILFTNNEKTEKTLFFTFPKGSIAGLQAIPFGETTTSNIIPDSTLINPTNNDTNIANTIQNSNENNYPNAGLKPTIPTPTLDINGQIINPTISPTTNTNIANYACVVPNTNTTIDNNSSNNNTNIQTNNNGNNNGDNHPSIDINDPNRSILPPSTNTITDSVNWDDTASMEKSEEQIKSCIKKCTDSNLKATDKAFCIAKCTCTTQRTENGMAGISICMIPTQQKDVLSSKPIQSIQEVINEINNVLVALKNSGELIKHNKTTEFLDTSLAKIKFNKILAVDVNIATKPIFPVTPKKKDNTETQLQTDRIANGDYGNIDIGVEKNKYAYYRNMGISGNIILTPDDSLPIIKENSTQALMKSQNAQVIESVRTFLMQNISFRDSIADIISSIQQTSDQIKQKITKK